MATLIRLCAVIALAALLYAFGGGWARAQAGNPAPQADPATWGLYAQLIGTEWTSNEGRGTVRWSWGEGKDAGSIVEQGEAENPRWIIRPGPTQGTLTKDFSRGVHHFLGTIAADGSVLWIRKGWIKIPHRLSLDGQELREDNGLELDGQEVVSVEYTYGFQQSSGPPVGAPVAAAVAAQAAAPEGSAPQADPAIWGVYAQLVGTEWTGKQEVRRGPLRWSWGEDENLGSIIQEGDYEEGRWIIRPGAGPGTLTRQFSRGGQPFRGIIAPDGSVLWIREGLFKVPHRVSLVGQELREESGLELEGDRVIAVNGAPSRFEQTGGPLVATAGATDAGTVTRSDPAHAQSATTTPANLPAAGASAQELEAAAAALLARASAQREMEAQAQQQARLTEARAARREAEAAADAAEQALAKAVAARAALESAAADARESQPVKKRATPPVYVYCTANSGPVLLFSNVFTIDHGGLAVGADVDTMATKVQGLWTNGDQDLFGQFIAMAESQGIKKRHTACYAVSSMDLLRRHYTHKDYYLSYLPVDWSRFGSWRPTGDFLIAAEAWGGVDSKGTRSAAARPPVPTAEMVAGLEQTADRARAKADAAAKAVEQQAAQTAAGTSPQQPRVAANATPAGAGLTVEPIPERAPAPKSSNSSTWQSTIICTVVSFSSYEGKRGAVFVSDPVPITLVHGQTTGAGPSFRAKVKARYGVGGTAGCETSTDSAVIDRARTVGFKAHPHFQHVVTGMKPL